MHHAHIDKFAYGDSAIHRLDARVKLLVTLGFTAVVLALPRTSPAVLSYYAIFPFALLVIGGIPLKFACKQVLLVSPFIVVLALSSAYYDRQDVTVTFGPLTWETTVGWLRCATIVGKFIVTMLALIALVSTTRFGDLLAAMQKLGVPQILTVQLGFLYRYIFVLIDRGHHILRARAARTLRRLGFKQELRTASAMLGSLFLSSVDTAERISVAMKARGFDGQWHTLSTLRCGRNDVLFVLAAGGFMLTLWFGAGRVL